MSGLIESGQKVTVSPFAREPIVGDIVLCKVNGRQYLHKVVEVKDSRFVIGNNRGHINGAVSRNQLFGICVKVEP